MIKISAQFFLLQLLLIKKEMVCPCLHFHVPSVKTCLNVLCMFYAYFCCNDISSSQTANFPATGKMTVESFLL